MKWDDKVKCNIDNMQYGLISDIEAIDDILEAIKDYCQEKSKEHKHNSDYYANLIPKCQKGTREWKSHNMNKHCEQAMSDIYFKRFDVIDKLLVEVK